VAERRTPDVTLVAPSAWIPAADVAPPKITSAAALTSFRALASPAGDAFLVTGCVAASIPGWVEDMRPAVEGRTIALLGAATEKAAGFPIDARPRGGGLFALRPAAKLDGPPIGVGRPFVGFDASHVVTCFASCVGKTPKDLLGCESAVADAHLSPDPPPPPPGLFLGSVTWAVHHPRPFARGSAVLLLIGVVLALVFRPRPRSRIFRER
jgi:hypothetical protein